MGVVAVVPVKDLRAAKARLSPALGPKTRHELALWMLERVLSALLATPGLDGVRVETADPEAVALAHRMGVGVIPEPGGVSGQSEAVEVAARALAAEGVEAMLMLPLDLPRADPAEIARILAEDEPHGAGPLVVLVPSRDGGTNAALRRPPTALPSRFGRGGSLRRHIEEAGRLGVSVKLLRLESLWIDVDTEKDFSDTLGRDDAYGWGRRSEGPPA